MYSHQGVGLAEEGEEEDDFDFEEGFTSLKEEVELNEQIIKNLNKIQLPMAKKNQKIEVQGTEITV